jgi:prevent-host-death family protein
MVLAYRGAGYLRCLWSGSGWAGAHLLLVADLPENSMALPYDLHGVPGGNMSTVSLTEAKTRMSQLLDSVEAGEEVIITRRGQPIARISPLEKPKHAVKSLAEFRSCMPRWRKPSVELVREMRDEDC